jgi:tRNA/rRNA methyltransferase
VVVLHQVRSPDNLGAVARLMVNFGFSTLRVSDPVTYAFGDAKKMAVKGDAVLERMQMSRTLEEGLADVVYACGSTSRVLEGRPPPLSPEAAADRLAGHAARGPVALVLGGEQRGLSDDELALCQDYLVVPTRPEQPSMNLAQAAAVLLYLCARAGEQAAQAGQAAGTEEAPPPGARGETLRALEDWMGQALRASEFLNPQAPEHVLGELWLTLARAGLSQREAEMWISAFKHLRRRAGGGG